MSGQHHFVTACYLYQYATRKEDNRPSRQQTRFTHTIHLALASAKSTSFYNYWQRRRMNTREIGT